MLVIGLGLDGAVVTSLLVPEPVIVVGHDISEVKQVAQLLDVVGGLPDLVDVAGQGGAQKKIFRFERGFEFLKMNSEAVSCNL